LVVHVNSCGGFVIRIDATNHKELFTKGHTGRAHNWKIRKFTPYTTAAVG
jgi:hypothetical protein